MRLNFAVPCAGLDELSGPASISIPAVRGYPEEPS
jgi:hypothetical protein